MQEDKNKGQMKETRYIRIPVESLLCKVTMVEYKVCLPRLHKPRRTLALGPADNRGYHISRYGHFTLLDPTCLLLSTDVVAMLCIDATLYGV